MFLYDMMRECNVFVSVVCVAEGVWVLAAAIMVVYSKEMATADTTTFVGYGIFLREVINGCTQCVVVTL